MLLWSRLRNGRLVGTNFRRQFPVPPYAVDFCNEKDHLLIEMDGSQHMNTVNADNERKAFLNVAVIACSDSGTTLCSRILIAY
jgi:very-short-patch-repair endonuclease